MILWQAHQRHLIYATFGADEMCISTDFSAQFDHKCAWTLTCEHPPRSNQAVYVVTDSPRDDKDGARMVTTDVWRIFLRSRVTRCSITPPSRRLLSTTR